MVNEFIFSETDVTFQAQQSSHGSVGPKGNLETKGKHLASRKEKVFFRFLFGGVGLIALLAFSPIIIGLIGFFISSQTGCEMNEGGPVPCYILGIDFGEFLAVGSMGAFIVFITVPAGFVAAGAYAILLLVLNRIFKFTT